MTDSRGVRVDGRRWGESLPDIGAQSSAVFRHLPQELVARPSKDHEPWVGLLNPLQVREVELALAAVRRDVHQ